MFSLPTLLSLISVFLLITCSCSLAVQNCPTFSCNPNEQDTVQFPFYVPGNQSSDCGFSGFDLTCGRNGQTFLTLASKPLTVRGISYPNQLLIASDPNSCLPNWVLNLNLTSSPYSFGEYGTVYSFLNCSKTKNSTLDVGVLPVGTSTVSCLSGRDFNILTTFENTSEHTLVKDMKCEVIKRVTTAFWWPEMSERFYPEDMSDVFLQLSWDVPSCGDCVQRGGICGFASDRVHDVVCSLPHDGLSKAAKYGLLLGFGVPSIICLIGLIFYISRRSRALSQAQTRRYSITDSFPAIFPQPVILTVGLDRPTIESYPKTILGESKRLPKPSDGTCPICLSEYQPKESLRSIPECNHYFHADCIDEWLRMNATCPLCRKSPQKPSAPGSR